MIETKLTNDLNLFELVKKVKSIDKLINWWEKHAIKNTFTDVEWSVGQWTWGDRQKEEVIECMTHKREKDRKVRATPSSSSSRRVINYTSEEKESESGQWVHLTFLFPSKGEDWLLSSQRTKGAQSAILNQVWLKITDTVISHWWEMLTVKSVLRSKVTRVNQSEIEREKTHQLSRCFPRNKTEEN